jgi:hypothetical protein
VVIEARALERVGGAGDDDSQGRIPFLLRIGVTGHRKIAESEELVEAVNDAIDLAISCSRYGPAGRRKRLKLAALQWRQRKPAEPKLAVVSALAEGADRLVAREVLNRGGNLVCVLPVAEGDVGLYRQDFESAESRQEFDELRERARQEIAPTERILPDQREDGYLWAGKAVVANSDVIIAIWDGQAPRGVGGTADLIHWLRDRDRDRRPDQSPEDLALGDPAPLRIIVHTSGPKAPYAEADKDPPYDVAAKTALERLKCDWDGLEAFNRMSFKPRDWQQWAGQTMDDLAPAEYRQWPRLNRLLEQIAPHLTRADQEAMAAQKAFRWSSYAFFGLTALATILAALQATVLTGVWELALGELVLIFASVIIVMAERAWRNNNKHWFVYRFLAERLRTTFYLLAVRSVPEARFDVGGTADRPMQNGWVQRAFTSILAEIGPDRERDIAEDPETLSSLIRAHWMTGQLNYFERTSKKMMRRHNTVRGLLYAVLSATIVAALLHSLRIWPFHSGPTETLIMCAIGLPAVAAALSNIRSIREFKYHAFRYKRMAAVVRWYLDNFPEEPDEKDLAHLAERVGSLLTAETRGWLVEVSGHNLEMH